MIEGLRIVIVEDDGLSAMDLADLLIEMGHDVRAIAQTEDEAIAAAIRSEPDLMIVDGNLIEGSGVSAMRRILTHGFVPHFFVTGEPSRRSGLSPTAIVIAKPFTMRDLAKGIAKARSITGWSKPATV